MSTRRYLISKVLQALLTLVFVLAFNFFLFRGVGDPVTQLLRGHAGITRQSVEQLQRQLGLDLPLPQQFVHYVKETLEGHLGYSYFYNLPVSQVIAGRIWPTVLLIGLSTLASTALGIWIGIRQGWRRGSRYDQGMLGFTLFTYSMPEFWFGLLVIMAFAVGVGPFPALFPTGGYESTGAGYTGFAHVVDVVNHMMLPFFVLRYFNVPFYFGGTALLIVVGVGLDTIVQVQQHLHLRHYDDFMKKGKIKFRGRRRLI